MMKAAVALMAVLLVGVALANEQLSMRADGTFKIAQFADIHFSTGTAKECSAIEPSELPYCNDYNTTAFIARVLDDEMPDFAVFTGDNVAGPPDAEWAIGEFAKPCIERGIPWAAVFGNHDFEGNMDNAEMMQVIVGLPYSLASAGPADIDGVGNYIIELLSADGCASRARLMRRSCGAFFTHRQGSRPQYVLPRFGRLLADRGHRWL